jgi:hypothetical protein
VALYYYQQFISQANHHPQFDTLYSPGERTAWSGIYRCEVCGKEAVHTIDKSLPPQNHHTHPQGQPIRWRCVVTDHA